MYHSLSYPTYLFLILRAGVYESSASPLWLLTVPVCNLVSFHSPYFASPAEPLVFHRSFWAIQRPHPANRSNRNYVFASAQRARQRFTKARNCSHILDSTSADASISNASMKHVTIKQEYVGKNNVLGPPRHEIASNQPRNEQNSSGMENVPAIESLDELDVEKGEASLAR